MPTTTRYIFSRLPHCLSRLMASVAVLTLVFTPLLSSADEPAETQAPAETQVPVDDPLDLDSAFDGLDKPDSDTESGANAGVALLDKAVMAKMNLKNMEDISNVIQLTLKALETGLDETNTIMAKDLLRATYLQRATILVEMVLGGSFTEKTQVSMVIQLTEQDLDSFIKYLPADSDREKFEGADIYWLLRATSQLYKDPNDATGLKALALARDLNKDNARRTAMLLMLEAQSTDEVSAKVRLMRQAYNLAPDNPGMVRKLALLLARTGQGAEAITIFAPFVEKLEGGVRENPAEYLLLMDLLNSAGRFEESINIGQQVNDLFPNNVPLLLNLCSSCLKIGMYDQFMTFSESILKKQPQNAAVLMVRARVFAKKQDYDKAIATINQLLFFQDDNLAAQEFLVALMVKNGQKDRAWQQLEQVLDTIEKTPSKDVLGVYNLYCLTVRTFDQKERAEQLKNTYLNLSEQMKTDYLLIETLEQITELNSHQQYDEVKNLVKQFLEQYPNLDYQQTLMLMLAVKDYEGILTLVDRELEKLRSTPLTETEDSLAETPAEASEENPQSAGLTPKIQREAKELNLIVTKMKILDQLGRKDEIPALLNPWLDDVDSLEQVTQLILVQQCGILDIYQPIVVLCNSLEKSQPDNLLILNSKTNAHLQLKNYPEALKGYEQLIRITPEQPSPYNNLSWLLSTCPDDSVRDGKRALELGLKAAELSGYKEAYILSTLAAAYAENGNYEKALEWINKAIEIAQAKLDENPEKQNSSEETDTEKKDTAEQEDTQSAVNENLPWVDRIYNRIIKHIDITSDGEDAGTASSSDSEGTESDDDESADSKPELSTDNTDLVFPNLIEGLEKEKASYKAGKPFRDTEK